MRKTRSNPHAEAAPLCARRKKAQPLNLRQRSEKSPPLSPENGGGVLLPHRRGKIRRPAAVLPETKKRAALGALFNDSCKHHIFLSDVPRRTPLSPPGFFNPLRCFSLRRACPTQPRREDFRTPQAPPPNRRLCGLPPAGEKSVAPPGNFCRSFPRKQKRGLPSVLSLTIIVKTIFWSAFQSVLRFLRRAFLTPCSAFLCGGLFPPRRNRPAVRPPKKAQPLNLRRRSEKSPPLSPENGGGVLLPHRKKKPAPAGEVLPPLSPKTKKVRFCGLSLNRRKAPGGQTGAFHS